MILIICCFLGSVNSWNLDPGFLSSIGGSRRGNTLWEPHPVSFFSATEGTLLGMLAMPWVGLRNLGEVWVSLQISLLSTPQLMQAHSISPFVLKREQLEGAVHFESEITSECAKLVSGYGEDGVRCMAISVSEPIASWQEGDDPAVTCTGGTPLTWQLGI